MEFKNGDEPGVVSDMATNPFVKTDPATLTPSPHDSRVLSGHLPDNKQSEIPNRKNFMDDKHLLTTQNLTRRYQVNPIIYIKRSKTF
jgi:hypothetical protein